MSANPDWQRIGCAIALLLVAILPDLSVPLRIALTAVAALILLWPHLTSLKAQAADFFWGSTERVETEQFLRESGQLASDTLTATAVVHGGKLSLSLPKPDEEHQRFIQVKRISGGIELVAVLIAIWNQDFHETVDAVSATVVSRSDAEHPELGYVQVGAELEPASTKKDIDPRSRLHFKLGVLEEHATPEGRHIRRFWLGKEGEHELTYGTYVLRIAYSGRNHSERSERFEFRYTATSVGIGPLVTS